MITENITDQSTEIIYHEVTQTNGQIQNKAFQYKITTKDSQILMVTVIASSGSSARNGLSQQFPDCVVSMLGVSDILIQVNDQGVFDV